MFGRGKSLVFVLLSVSGAVGLGLYLALVNWIVGLDLFGKLAVAFVAASIAVFATLGASISFAILRAFAFKNPRTKYLPSSSAVIRRFENATTESERLTSVKSAELMLVNASNAPEWADEEQSARIEKLVNQGSH